MPNSRSAKQSLRINETKRLRNRASRTELRSVIKKFREVAAGEDKPAAETAYRQAVKKLDQAAARGLIHKNKASRSKSRLSKLLAD